MKYWLTKQEPSGYNIAALKRDGRTVWDGVHNNLALKHIRAMRKGDLALFYHTGSERQAVGIMQIVSDPYPNPEEDDERFVVVDVKYKSTFKSPVTLDAIKADRRFAGWDLLRLSRLSVMPVPPKLWNAIIKMSG